VRCLIGVRKRKASIGKSSDAGGGRIAGSRGTTNKQSIRSRLLERFQEGEKPSLPERVLRDGCRKRNEK